jgi:hypothetical protein
MGQQGILEALKAQEGGLIEIYVLGASFDNWRRALNAIMSLEGQVSLIDSETGSPAPLSREMFGEVGGARYSLAISIRGQNWTSTFPSESAIDLQGDPREVRTLDDLETVVELMRILNLATEKRVILVPETVDPEAVDPYLIVP